MRSVDNAPRLTQPALLKILNERCAVRVLLGERTSSKTANERDFYIVRFSGGMVKVGTTDNIKSRLRSLAAEATQRFPGIDQGQTITVIAVVPGAGRSLEVGMLRALRHGRIQGEWFRGGLADAVVDVILESTAEAQAAE